MADKSSFLGSISPWASRAATPKPVAQTKETSARTKPKTDPPNHSGVDHTVSTPQFPRLSDYPKDCPPLRPHWFYATDSPKRKAAYIKLSSAEVLPQPKKFSAFSARDSSAIESSFQTILEATSCESAQSGSSLPSAPSQSDESNIINATKVPVNEDFLFDVDINKRELVPAYWLGPVYDVRRGSWFYHEGVNLRPCDENLSAQLERGYIKTEAWLASTNSTEAVTSPKIVGNSNTIVEKSNVQTVEKKTKNDQPQAKRVDPKTMRLFGNYMNSMVTYQDASTAWLQTDDFLSRMSGTVYQRLAGGAHLGGVKVVRGYSEAKARELKDKRDKAKSQATGSTSGGADTKMTEPIADPEPAFLKLERQLSNLDPAIQEAEARRRDEDEIKEDYKLTEGDDQGREIEHLVLVTHGIGQKLGARLEMLNFISDVNTFRKTVKAVYQNSPDLQLLNSEVNAPKNSRIQVLPVVWRHLLDFPKQSFKSHREMDVADAEEDDEYPSLESISLEPSTIIRAAIRDLGLDILMYQSAYRDHISQTVVSEANKVYAAFCKRHPNFNGKVSLVGHSLGSAILFDVLCKQGDENSTGARERAHSSQRQAFLKTPPGLKLDFEVEDYFCLGSPLGLFQMLNGRQVVGRHCASRRAQSTVKGDLYDSMSFNYGEATTEGDLFAVGKNSPCCSRLFNIFHPADPIAYRLEPLISTAMSSLKPQPLPYTKKGIFDVQGQGLSAIGNRVGQSVSDLWSSVTGGVASSLLNRTLGLPADTQLTKDTTPQIERRVDLHRPGSGLDDVDGTQPPTLIDRELETLYAGFEKRRKSEQAADNTDSSKTEAWKEADKRASRLKREEAKVKSLNSNGRVDFAIQTGVFDLTNPMTSIASHLAYWGDEDVNHFIVSQLLSKQRIMKK